MSRLSLRPRGFRRRAGLSLLEVIIATAVLAASAAVIGQLVGVAVQHGARVSELTEAHTLCHNIMNELVAGIRPWENVTAAQAVDPWTPWDYEVKIEPLGFSNLAALTVTVIERPQTALSSASASASASASGQNVSSTLGDSSTSARPMSRSSSSAADGRRRYRWTRWVRQELPEDPASEPTARKGSPFSRNGERLP